MFAGLCLSIVLIVVCLRGVIVWPLKLCIYLAWVFVVLCVPDAIKASRRCWLSGPPIEDVGPGCELVLRFELDLARMAISSMPLKILK